MFSVFNFVFGPNLAGSDLKLDGVLVLKGKNSSDWLVMMLADGLPLSFIPPLFSRLYPEKQLKMVDTL